MRLPQALLNDDDDWIETTRGSLYPLLHDPLSRVGDIIGVNLYATGHVYQNQRVGRIDEPEELIEEQIVEAGARRNPIACLKSLPDGRESEGSWVFLSDDHPEIEDGMQVHFTLFQPRLGESGRTVYAHYEDDWRVEPLAHLRAKAFSPERGVSLLRLLLDTQTELEFE